MCACGVFLQKGLDWRKAADKCYAQGARLPEVMSAKENADILSIKVVQVFCIRLRESYKRFLKTWICFANPWIYFNSIWQFSKDLICGFDS